MIGEISYVQFALLCIFTFGCMALIIYIVADELKRKAQWEVERSSGAELKGVIDSPQPSVAARWPDASAYTTIGTQDDDELQALYRTDVVDLDEAMRRVQH